MQIVMDKQKVCTYNCLSLHALWCKHHVECDHRDSNMSCTIIVWIYIFIQHTEVKITAIVHYNTEMKNSVPVMCL